MQARFLLNGWLSRCIEHEKMYQLSNFHSTFQIDEFRSFISKQIYGNSYYCVYLIGFGMEYCQQALVQINFPSSVWTQYDDRENVEMLWAAQPIEYLHFKRKLLAAFDYDSCREFISQLKKINSLQHTHTHPVTSKRGSTLPFLSSISLWQHSSARIAPLHRYYLQFTFCACRNQFPSMWKLINFVYFILIARKNIRKSNRKQRNGRRTKWTVLCAISSISKNWI